jgi:hypothetical protein
MADYYSIIARAVSRLPGKADEARHAIYEEAHKALHERLGNDPQISHDELVNEHYRLEAAIYEVEDDLLLRDMRRFVSEETALSSPRLSFISRLREFVDHFEPLISYARTSRLLRRRARAAIGGEAADAR